MNKVRILTGTLKGRVGEIVKAERRQGEIYYLVRVGPNGSDEYWYSHIEVSERLSVRPEQVK